MEIVLDPLVKFTQQYLILDIFVFALLALIPYHSSHDLLHLILDGRHIFLAE